MHTSPQDTFTYCFSLSNGRNCQSDAYSINWILSHYEPPLWSCTIRPMWHDDIRNKGTLIARTSLHLSGIVEILDLMGSRKKNIFWLLLHGDLYFAKQKRNQKHGNTEGVWKTANQPNKSKTPNKILQYVSFHFNPTSVAQTIQFSLQWCEAQQIDSESIWRAAPGWVERRCRGRLSQRQRWVPVSLSPFMSKMTERADCGPQCIREAISCSNESVIGTRWRESNTCGWSRHRLRT